MVTVKKLSMVIAGAALSAVSLGIEPARALHLVVPNEYSQQPSEPSEHRHEEPLVVTPDTPRPTFDQAGNRFRFLSLGSETDNKYATFEVTAPLGEGVPQHIHQYETEAFYLVEGQLTLNLHNDLEVVEAGTYAYLPKGLDHGFVSSGTTPAKVLAFALPGGFTDAFVQGTGTPVTDPNTAIPPSGDNLPQQLASALPYTLNFFPETWSPYEGNETYHVVLPDEPDRPVSEALGGDYTSLDNLEQTRGQFSFLDVLLPPQAGSGALQIDEQQDQQLYVLDGNLQFQVGDQTTVGTPGSYVYVPEGTPYSFQNLDTTPARTLLVSSPADVEQVPEPSSLLGLLGVGAYFGVSLVLKRKQKKQKLVNLGRSTCLSQP